MINPADPKELFKEPSMHEEVKQNLQLMPFLSEKLTG